MTLLTAPRARKARAGQAMLMTVLAMGGAVLGATAIAGLLMLYQIRGTTDIQNSAKAIEAADTGVEWALYNYFKVSVANPTLGNGATILTTCYDNANNPVACNPAGGAQTAIAKGIAGSSARAFFLDFAGQAQIYP